MTKKQFVVVPDGEVDSSQFLGEVVLVDDAGEPWSPGGGDSSPVTWAEITGKPSTFTPSTHTHTIADITGLEARLAAAEAKIEVLEGGGE